MTRCRVLATSASGLALVSAPAVLRAQSSVLKVGVILPLSGVISFPGIATRRGTELAAKMFADEGIKLDVQFADTKSKPENGRVAAEKLVRDGATILVGAWDSGATISAAQAAEATKVPLWWLMSALHPRSPSKASLRCFATSHQLPKSSEKV